MKSSTLLGLCLAASIILVSACSKQAAPATGSATAAAPTPDKIKIGYLVKQPEEPWFQYEWKGADKAAAQYGFELIKQGVQDGEKVMAMIDNLAVAGAQGFVICTPDVRLGPAIMARAKQHNLKVVIVDDQFLKEGKFMTEVPYVGMSATRIGTKQGETLAAEMKKRGWTPADTAVCAITFEELDTARERTDSSIAALEKAGVPADRIFKGPQKSTDIPGSFDAANVLLTQHPDVKHWLILGMNDSAVLGAVRAVEARGFTADTAVGVGINGTDCIDELSKAKPTPFFGSMLASAPAEGFQSSEMLYKWIKDGTPPPPDTRSEGMLITRENFKQVLKHEGIL
ncbi:MAG TPA: arabinose ABC transporter substrate-binding protein [Lacunisphaera sp.]|jgi:L-arabinose transport system substrate-binding protein